MIKHGIFDSTRVHIHETEIGVIYCTISADRNKLGVYEEHNGEKDYNPSTCAEISMVPLEASAGDLF